MKKIIIPVLMALVCAVAGCDEQLSSLMNNSTTAAAALTAAADGSAALPALPMDSDQDGAVTKDEWTSFHAEIFSRIDSNGDGQLSTDELAAGGGGERPGMRPPAEGIDADGDGVISSAEWTSFHDAMFATIDENGDGSLSADELAAHKPGPGHGPAGGPPFDRMDSDRDGTITADEWTSFHAGFFDTIDADQDGYLSAEEQKTIMPGGPGPDRGRNGMDSDGDGAISKQEWSDFYATLFSALDVNGDGMLAKDELKP